MQKDTQMEIIADYYKVLGNHSLNERFSKEGDRVYTFPDTDAWLVLERKGENAIQARMTDEKGVIVSWDNYEVMNASVKQIESVRLSVSGRSRISFTSAEINVIDRYGDYDRRTTMGKLDILLDRFKDDSTKKSAQAVIDKLGRISDKSYADLYSVDSGRWSVRRKARYISAWMMHGQEQRSIMRRIRTLLWREERERASCYEAYQI